MRLRKSAIRTWCGVVFVVLTLYCQSTCQETPVSESVPEDTPRFRHAKGSLEGTLDPDAYMLGAGDVLTIGFWGDVNRVETVTVNPDGYILVAPVGPISVDGLTLSEVQSLVKDNLSAYYRPSILSVSLVSIRSFQAHVVGMVTVPGAVEVNGATRVSQAISMAEGLTAGASQRNIVVKRGDESIPVDLTRYYRLGDNSRNPFLNDGDVVYVPGSPGAVRISGSVFQQGAYEFVQGETLADLIDLAGGFRPEAHTETIEIERFDVSDPSVSRSMVVKGEPALLEGFDLKLGDRIFVRAVPDWHRDAQVDIAGEVRYPGVYVIEEGAETLSGLVARAGGLTPEASLAEARLVRGFYANRRFPVERELGAVRDLQDSFERQERDLIKTMAREAKGTVAVSFEKVFLGNGQGYDPLLMDGDLIQIPRASRLVRVSGQVENPGLILMKDDEKFRYYIKKAGGFAPKADTRGTLIIRASSGQKVTAGGQEVLPGDIIWVPTVREHDWWEITKDVLTVLAQVATIWLVADGITGK